MNDDKFAVLKDGKIIKTYPTRDQCLIWCYENGLVINHFSDFPDDWSGLSLRDGTKIVELVDLDKGTYYEEYIKYAESLKEGC